MSLPLPSWNRRAHRPRATFVSLLLLATLGLAGLLARQAQVAASSHRAVAERTLTDYAAFAAWKSAGVIKSELFWIYGMALQPLFEGNAAADSAHVPYPAAFVIPPEKTKAPFRRGWCSPTSGWTCGRAASPRAASTCPPPSAPGWWTR